jgi:gliding motility-associated-like protein
LMVRKPGQYIGFVTLGDCVLSDTINIGAKPNTIDFGVADSAKICRGEPYTLKPKSKYQTYLWKDGSSQPSFTVTESGDYALRASSECGVFDKLVNIQFVRCDCDVFVPNVFSPNGDLLNDLFKPYFGCGEAVVQDYHFAIFDRFGEYLFDSNDPLVAWDGNYRGRLMPSGVYSWFLEYGVRNTKGEVKSFLQSGDVGIVR